jgi:hypothetical protein
LPEPIPLALFELRRNSQVMDQRVSVFVGQDMVERHLALKKGPRQTVHDLSEIRQSALYVLTAYIRERRGLRVIREREIVVCETFVTPLSSKLTLLKTNCHEVPEFVRQRLICDGVW